MRYSNHKAFTLVELIVVITILAILGTITFISLQGYSKQARDSRRVSDVSNIKTSLELFSLNTGKYPIPDTNGIVSYSGEILFTQGFVGDNVTSNLSNNLQEKPLDPLHEIEYIYSTTNSRKEYEVLAFYEGTSSSSPLLRRRGVGGEGITYAANLYKQKITGNYNGLFVKTKNFIVPLPSIITSENLNYDLKTETGKIDSMIISGGNNYPNVGIAGVEQKTGELDINLSVHEGTITKDSTNEEKIQAIEKIQLAYSGTTLATNPIIENILSKTTNEELINFADVTVLGTGKPMESSTPILNSCEINPGYTNATFTEGIPTSPNTVWQNTDSGAACYYSCNLGFSGNDCNTVVTYPFPTNSTLSGSINYNPIFFTPYNSEVRDLFDGFVRGGETNSNIDSAIITFNTNEITSIKKFSIDSYNNGQGVRLATFKIEVKKDGVWESSSILTFNTPIGAGSFGTQIFNLDNALIGTEFKLTVLSTNDHYNGYTRVYFGKFKLSQ